MGSEHSVGSCSLVAAREMLCKLFVQMLAGKLLQVMLLAKVCVCECKCESMCCVHECEPEFKCRNVSMHV